MLRQTSEVEARRHVAGSLLGLTAVAGLHDTSKNEENRETTAHNRATSDFRPSMVGVKGLPERVDAGYL